MKNEIRLLKKILGNNKGGIELPYKINFAVTYKCNSRCRTCNIWHKTPHNELTTEEIDTFFRKNDFQWVSLTGGEPFLRNDLSKIVQSADESMNLSLININTNGFLTDRIIESLKEIKGVNASIAINISLDGDPAIHNKTRGISDAFDKVIRTYKETRKNIKNIDVFFSYTVSQYNIGKATNTFKYLQEQEGINPHQFHFNFYTKSTHYYSNNATENKLDINKKLFEEINFLKKTQYYSFNLKSLLEKKYLSEANNFFSTGKAPLPCQALKASCFIDPTGNVYPCINWDQPLGNIRDSNYDLNSIWYSKKTNRIRKKIAQGFCPQCWTSCEGYQSIISHWAGYISKFRP